MKLFYHFLVLVAASLILIACANMFASTPEKKLDRPSQRSGVNFDKDSLLNSGINTRLEFPDHHNNDVLSKYINGSHQTGYKIHSFNNLLIAANYFGLNQIEK